MSMSGLYDARISSSIGIPEVRAEYNVENGNSDPPIFRHLTHAAAVTMFLSLHAMMHAGQMSVSGLSAARISIGLLICE
jgi:hypothetical protein